MTLLHTGGADAGLTAGLLHPVFGLDHLLAMVSVGVVSSQLGGKDIWRVPLVFVAAMATGGVWGIRGFLLPFSEYGIAVSLVFLGVCVAMAKSKTSPALISIFVAVFGVFHGYAHGVETPRSVSPALYALGFLISTATLHIFGVVIGELSAMKKFSSTALRVAGILIALAGVYFLVKQQLPVASTACENTSWSIASKDQAASYRQKMMAMDSPT